MSESSIIVTLVCDSRPGIIAAVTTAIADLGGNITETHQHWDRPTDRFFLRVAFLGPESLSAPAAERALAPLVERFGMDLGVTDAARPPRIIAMVSKFDHTLLHLLYQIRVPSMPASTIGGVGGGDHRAPDRVRRQPVDAGCAALRSHRPRRAPVPAVASAVRRASGAPRRTSRNRGEIP